jgi:hypothetical protein
VQEIYLVPPVQINNSAGIYLLHNGMDDIPFAGQLYERTHDILIALLILASSTQDDLNGAMEDVFLDLTDQITSAFFGNHTINGTAATCEYAMNKNNPPYVMINEAVYRYNSWTLLAKERFVPPLLA